MLTLEQIETASRTVYRHMAPTPLYRWPLLTAATGAEVWVKHENHSPIGCFKLRGGLTYIESLMQLTDPPKGVIAPTRGNHGQSISYASRVFGLPAYIVVPHGNSPEKNAAMQAHGGILIEHGYDYQESREFAIAKAEREGLHMVRSFTPQLLRGVATYPLEILRAEAELDAIYVPIGMGSGISATLLTRDLLNSRTKVIGVVADTAPSYALSFEAGKVVPTATADTIADGLACRTPDPGVVELVHKRAERIVRVSDQEMLDAVALLLRTTHNLAECSGAAALAALCQERDRMKNRRVAVILSGGNLDSSLLPFIKI